MKKKLAVGTIIGILIISMITLIRCHSLQTENVDLSQYFKNANGCFVLLDSSNNKYSVFNKDMANNRISPFSTFKILNALIGLETGVVEDENTTFKWNGKKYQIDTWNGDQTLDSAIKNSVVWYFQILAKDVGNEKMKFYINKVGYGNCDISGGIDKFWLNSSLKISPMEQVEFLKKFHDLELPFKAQNIKIVQKIIFISQIGNSKLYGKTGSEDGKQAWFIGYIENSGKTYYFATFMNGSNNIDGTSAKTVTTNILNDMGLIN